MNKALTAIILPAVMILMSHLAASRTDSPALNAELIEAVQTGDKARVQRLLQEGASVEERDSEGFTALFWATSPDITQLLLDKGANIEAKDNYGYTALFRAAQYGWTDVVKLLLDSGANSAAKDKNGKTAADLATSMGHPDVVKLLRERSSK